RHLDDRKIFSRARRHNSPRTTSSLSAFRLIELLRRERIASSAYFKASAPSIKLATGSPYARQNSGDRGAGYANVSASCGATSGKNVDQSSESGSRCGVPGAKRGGGASKTS